MSDAQIEVMTFQGMCACARSISSAIPCVKCKNRLLTCYLSLGTGQRPVNNVTRGESIRGLDAISEKFHAMKFTSYTVNEQCCICES